MRKDFTSITDFLTTFPDEQSCRAYFERRRFAQGDYCPHCKHTEIFRYADKIRYRCKACKQDFTIKTGTLFGVSKVPLQKWFMALYLLTTHKKGISSVALAKYVGVTQKTAWFMDHRIREALKQGTHQLYGTVEADETYVGGLEKNKHANKRTRNAQGRSTRAKVPMIGLLQRGGEVRAKAVSDVKVATVESNIIANVRPGSKIYTDDFFGYSKLKKLYDHGIVKHGHHEYVNGDIHSNGLESFWAIFKRGFKGSYHVMSRKHLQRYADEFVFRFNHRHASMSQIFLTALDNMSKYGTISYKKLIL